VWKKERKNVILNVFKCNVVYININKHIYNYRDQKIGLKVETSISRGSKQKIVLNFNYRGSIFPVGSTVDTPPPWMTLVCAQGPVERFPYSHSRVFQSNTKVKVKFKKINSIFIWWYPIQLLLGLTIHAIYKTRAGSILAIDRPGIRTRARCVKPELSGDATAELSILFDRMSAFIEIVLSQLILLDCSHD